MGFCCLIILQDLKMILMGGFCYQAGGVLKYSLSKKIYLLLDANYFYSSPVLKYNYNPDYPNQGPATAKAKRNYNVSSVNIFFGAGVVF